MRALARWLHVRFATRACAATLNGEYSSQNNSIGEQVNSFPPLAESSIIRNRQSAFYPTCRSQSRFAAPDPNPFSVMRARGPFAAVRS